MSNMNCSPLIKSSNKVVKCCIKNSGNEEVQCNSRILIGEWHE